MEEDLEELEVGEEQSTKKKIKGFFNKLPWWSWVVLVIGIILLIFFAISWLSDENALTHREKIYTQESLKYTGPEIINWTNRMNWTKGESIHLQEKLSRVPKDIKKNVWLMIGLFILIILIILIAKKVHKYKYLSWNKRCLVVKKSFDERKRIRLFNYNAEIRFLLESATKSIIEEKKLRESITMGFVVAEVNNHDKKGWVEYLVRIDPRVEPEIEGHVRGWEEKKEGFRAGELFEK